MPDITSLILPFLHKFPAETAHNLAIQALRYGWIPSPKSKNNARGENPKLTQNIFGLRFKNPVGLAAGFDKNAVAINALLRQNFGFVEVGTVTPLPQEGNPKPRVFRLSEDKAIINRLGFNNKGLNYFAKNFTKRDPTLGIAGANIGKNKNTENAIDDYITGLRAVYPYADYITINISSPNTKGLRDLQQSKALSQLLFEISNARSEAMKQYKKQLPIVLKIAPDINEMECEDIAEAVLTYGINGLIVSNTTLSRPASLVSQHRKENGGLSGVPLFSLSTEIVSRMYRITNGKIPIIGVGGIASPQDAYAKICAGASLIQMYSAFTYQGFGLVEAINGALPEFLMRDGFSNIREAVGSKL